MTERPMTSIDLFAGCGGLSLGLHRAGWDGLFAIERDPMAFDTLRTNLVDDAAPFLAFQKWPAWVPREPHDIVAFLSSDANREHLRGLRGSVTLIAGGPPCQGFSIGGARNGTDERNHLVHQLLLMVELMRPEVALIENVEGITRRFQSRPRDGGTGSVADEVVEAFTKLGYRANYGVADASRFGVPQTRRRAIIIAVRDDVVATPESFFEKLEDVRAEHLRGLGLRADRPVTAGEALIDLVNTKVRVPCPDSAKFDTSPFGTARSAYSKLMRGGARTGSIPDSHRYTKHGERVLELYDEAHKSQPKGRLSKAFLMSMGTKKDKKVLIDPDRPVSTITTHPDEFIHFAEPRNVTVREMARLQSFPDAFHFRGRYTINGPRRKFDVARCSQVGNAVPPHFAQAIGSAVRAMLDE